MNPLEQSCVVLQPGDNVAIAIHALDADAPALPLAVKARTAIPVGHKIALREIPAGTAVIKYGQMIAITTEAIPAGAHVHTHNARMPEYRGTQDHSRTAPKSMVDASAEPARTFLGYKREDGRVGTRNYIAVVATVNCSSTVAKAAADDVWREMDRTAFGNIDGIIAITHGSGCCMDAEGEPLAMLRRTLAGYITHPNVAATVVVGLGCEVNQISGLLSSQGLQTSARLHALTIQETGGTRATVETIKDAIRDILPKVNAVSRTEQPVSALTLALQCGGSDGYSGVTANPALGFAADLIVAQGGSAILSETPEIYGAEHLLLDRAVSSEVAQRLIDRIRWWEDYTAKLGGDMNNNPTPGNKAGGLTTILEKSLGAVAKGGSMPLTGVYHYAERPAAPGFCFMDSPGYDPCSITGQVASGANIICFTTGRGSVYGNKPVPSLKLATSTALFERLKDDMDINCGAVVSEGCSVQEMGRVIFEAIIATASGQRSKSEMNGLGDCEFVPWNTGAVM